MPRLFAGKHLPNDILWNAYSFPNGTCFLLPTNTGKKVRVYVRTYIWIPSYYDFHREAVMKQNTYPSRSRSREGQIPGSDEILLLTMFLLLILKRGTEPPDLASPYVFPPWSAAAASRPSAAGTAAMPSSWTAVATAMRSRRWSVAAASCSATWAQAAPSIGSEPDGRRLRNLTKELGLGSFCDFLLYLVKMWRLFRKPLIWRNTRPDILSMAIN